MWLVFYVFVYIKYIHTSVGAVRHERHLTSPCPHFERYAFVNGNVVRLKVSLVCSIVREQEEANRSDDDSVFRILARSPDTTACAHAQPHVVKPDKIIIKSMKRLNFV